MTEDFQWSEETEQKRLTVVLDGDTDVTEGEAREAIKALVESNTGVEEDTSVSTDSNGGETRRYERGFSA
ncbi:hypothetical protein [Halorubrum halophilum]|uniref:hypothetical protein n=1 Tax=Halorubrum halophilum TaxID=413816 RepID=UPI00186B36F3|nr:hypothetical protein [Halorubrum halophilum]